MKRKTKRLTLFIILNLALLAAVIVTGIYKKYSADTGNDPFGLCVLHDIFHLYCPGCGGTRAVMLLARFDIWGALMSNPIVPYFAALYAYLAVRAAVSILRDCDRIFYWSNALTWMTVLIPVTVFVLRNLLLVFFGIDTLGDLYAYWI
jgi:hypothetical protein